MMNIIYINKEDKRSVIVQEVVSFLNAHPFNSGGAIKSYEISIEEVDDGDSYVRVRLPVWSQNRNIIGGVLNIINKRDSLEHLWGTSLYFKEDEVIINFIYSVCDPD